ncbi:MAG: DUF1501 domain-containing protein [Rhodospirillales bacterium]
MTLQKGLSRRGFLAAGQGLLVTAALAKPALVWAGAPGEQRLVVVVLRGGLDGLDLLRPYEDPDWLRLRPNLAKGAGKVSLEVAPGFALHPSLKPLLPLWEFGELAFAPAVATPYRDQRSHFEGQDILEQGGAVSGERQDGWLNRVLGALPGTRPKGYAVAVARNRMLLLSGRQEALFWSPGSDLRSEETASLLDLLYAEDPLFARALSAAREADVVGDQVRAGLSSRKATPKATAQLAAEMLKQEARIAALSMGGWDTHVNQEKRLARGLKQLAEALLALREDLGQEVWGKTTVMTVTEFGRTVAENGSAGTDHGTAAVMLLAGGALRGRRLYGEWPGLGEGQLYDDRDLLPTQDMRLYPAWALHSGFGLSRAALESDIFPGLAMGGDPKIL